MPGAGDHTCNPNCLGAKNQESCALRAVLANSLKDPIAKITRGKWTGGVAQAVECLLVSMKP
jgi:hypothetical protein